MNRITQVAALLVAMTVSVAASAQDLAAGEIAYGVCVSCHGAKGEGKPDDICPDQTDIRRIAGVRPDLPIQDPDAENAQKMQPHRDNDGCGNPAEDVEILAHH